MHLTIDQILVLGIVAVAAAFLARRVVRSLRAARDTAAGCASDCGCSTSRHEETRRV